jgi:hypothetical protein
MKRKPNFSVFSLGKTQVYLLFIRKCRIMPQGKTCNQPYPISNGDQIDQSVLYILNIQRLSQTRRIN